MTNLGSSYLPEHGLALDQSRPECQIPSREIVEI